MLARAGLFRAVAQLAIDHTGETGAGAGLGQHSDPEAGPDETLDVRETRTMAHNLRAIPWRGCLRDQEVMQLRTWVPPAEKDLFPPQIDPMRRIALGEHMTFRRRDENALGP